MAIKKITYLVKGKEKKIEVKICDTLLKKFQGLMFRKNSPPLLFVFNKEKKLSIHSIFCKPFTAIWLDNKMHATQVLEINDWRTNIVGKGRYLLEIPRTTTKGRILDGESGI
ncbi:MAG: DUF192 domain-containing protein [Nanoarchaeota archaeon]|nr:DUF192 domain-containing protein [Nanoarchaeota archaeon]